LQRFGQLRTLYDKVELYVADERDRGLPAGILLDDPVEKRINEAMHFTKKALKKVLRQQATRDELRPFVDHLTSVMRDYPADIRVPGGQIGYVAHTYLDMAEALLADQ
jgi:hypothetical protein